MRHNADAKGYELLKIASEPMQLRGNTRRRRATILLMVVSVLALLVVIVASFLSIARNSRALTLEVTRGEATDKIIDSVNDIVTGLIANQLRDSQGNIFGGQGNTFSYEDIPGYAHSHYLSASEPIWHEGLPQASFTANPLLPNDFSALTALAWPAVTSLDGDAKSMPTALRLVDLMVEDDQDNDDAFEAANNSNDVARYALSPFMDADADGLPDSHLLLGATATEAANAAVGRSVSLPGADFAGLLLNPARIPTTALPDNPQRLRWEQWKRSSKYAVATRVISHGGMLALDAPAAPSRTGAVPPPQRGFVMDMFDALRNVNDNNTFKGVYNTTLEQDELFGALASTRDAVEGALRRRFLLPSAQYEDSEGDFRLDAPVLETLQRASTGFPRTFIPALAGLDNTNKLRPLHQRINIANIDTPADERPLPNWASAVSYPAASGAGSGGFGNSDDLNRYDRRHLLTTTNNSDELARKQDPAEPTGLVQLPAPLSSVSVPMELRTYRGELKMYLGEPGKAFDAVGATYVYNAARGAAVVNRAARLFSDMLFSAGDATDWSTLSSTNHGAAKSVLSKPQQAYMLAVNLLGFASPRDNSGWIEPAYFTEPGTSLTYVGFGPQPFISEVIAYNAAAGPGTPPGDQISLAVELFNPFDSGGGANDPFALNANQYAISVEEMDDPMGGGGVGSGQIALGSQPTNGVARVFNGFAAGANIDRFVGRSFKAFIITDANGNSAFDSVAGAGRVTIPDRVFEDTGNLTVRLWQASRATMGWFCIDEVQISAPTQNAANDPVWNSVRREVMPSPHLGAKDIDGDALVDVARWGVVTARVAVASGVGGAPVLNGIGAAKYLDAVLGLVDPDTTAAQRISPDTPFPTMNAAPFNDLPLFGNASDLRPRSFPTAAYLFFMPRFAHVSNGALGDANPQKHLTLGKILQAQWALDAFTDSDGDGLIDYPADFGHMPVFDNGLDGEEYFKDVRAGMVPWGQLVFDYFTTLDPQAPGVDPLRVAGRLNANISSWYVLSRLPLLGPDKTSGRVPILARGVAAAPNFADPSPSFWDPTLGVMAGNGVDAAGQQVGRFLGRQFGTTYQKHMPHYDNVSDRWRLGDWLAISAAGYRDGLQYLPGAGSSDARVFADSHLRGTGSYQAGGTATAVDYRPTVYRSTRGERNATSPDEAGFLSVGELLNVKGFDSTMPASLPPIAPNASLTMLANRPAQPLPGLLLAAPDYLKAVSLLTAMDTQYLTTRSNTFTVYASVMDSERPESSVRSQLTVDRSNLLPRLDYAWIDEDGDNRQDPLEVTIPRLRVVGGTAFPVRTENKGGAPQVIAARRGSYFATQHND